VFDARSMFLPGRLSPGFLADIVVLDRNILADPADSLPQTTVLRTYVNGVERFTHPSMDG
jgi:predicted amidohydrolase YtcJ